ncbi:MAG: phosphoglycerate dehydrogenase [Candidatus Howiella sp.]|jgi:D-3-phosphoglycerate dehydrogenase
MFQIKTLNKISPSGLSLLDPAKYTHGDEMENPDAVLVRSASMHDMAFGDNLKAIARAGAGTNNIPVADCAKQGIVVFNTPGANANAVKELVILGMLISSRRVVPAIEWAKTLKGEGDAVGKLVEKGKGAFAGPELKGKSLGVVGLGAIGVLVANAATHLGMKVYGYDPYLSVDSAWNLSRSVIHSNDIKDIYENCDYITLHVPLTPDTKGLVNQESIGMMKDGVRILNFARGDLVETADLLTALDANKVSAYVTDFPSDEVIGADGVIAIPHLGASTPESEDNCAAMAANELIEYLENGNIINSVNMPSVSMARTAGSKRVCVIHGNVPNMIAKITAAFSDENINIENMLNKSKKDFAYTILDVADATDAVLKAIDDIEGVIRIRVID